MAKPIISIDHLSRHYGERIALNNLSLDIAPGEIFGFLGPNGSGKTTLFRVLSTLIPATSGTVQYNFDDGASFVLDRSSLFSIRQRIGVVFQAPSLDKELTAAENLRHHGHLYGFHGAELESRVREMLDRVGLLDRADDRVKGFSGGMQRRVEIAKGLLTRPCLLLLDEPATGIDPAARIEMWKELERIRSEGVTILLTTHLMEEADQCSRLAIMDRGKLVVADSPSALKSRIGGDVITLSTRQIDRVAGILAERFSVKAEQMDQTLRFERANGGELVPQLIEAMPELIDSVSVGKPTLVDVFVDLTGNRFADEK
ncbi:MAG TPA: ATP-binding cassette domain-containing protein [Tepidisphaeraceae bacterium]|nr:ATP-binding cassette domain-containing protein [Tepidisphaeraceae bacterium]